MSVPAPAIAWVNQFGTSAFDRGYGIYATDGMVYVTGDTSGQLNGEPLNSYADAFVVAYLPDGSLGFTKLVSAGARSVGTGIHATSDGSIYITGAADTPDTISFDASQKNAFVTKINPDRSIAWTNLVPSVTDLRSTFFESDIAVAQDGSVYVTGTTMSPLIGGVSNSNAYDAYLIKYSANGELLWTKFIGTGGQSGGGYAIDVGSDNSIYISGWTYGGFNGELGVGDFDGFLGKYDQNGTVQWTRVFGSPMRDGVWGMDVSPEGIIAVAGEAGAGFDGQSHSGGRDTFVKLFDANGNSLWTDIYGTTGEDGAFDVTITPNGNVYSTGYTNGALGQYGEILFTGESSAFVKMLDKSGATVWTDLIGTSGQDVGQGIAAAPDNSVYVTGFTQGMVSEMPSNGWIDAFLVKYHRPKVTREFSGDYDFTVTGTPSAGRVVATQCVISNKTIKVGKRVVLVPQKSIATVIDETFVDVDIVSITGGISANTLNAQAWSGLSVLNGQGGIDTLIGGFNHDTLTGGLGADVFCFYNAPNEINKDTITDFTSAVDKIRIKRSAFAGLTGSKLSSQQFLSGAGITSATTTMQRFLYDTTTGTLSYDRDGSGSIYSPIQVAVLGAGTPLLSTDFQLVA